MSDLSRRDLLAALGSVTCCSAAASLVGCADDLVAACVVEDAPAGGGYLVAAFEVSHTSVIIWALGPSVSAARVELLGAGACEIATYAIELLEAEAVGAIGSTMIDDLIPSRGYECLVSFADGRRVGPIRFTTAPPPDESVGLAFAVSADIGPEESLDVFDVIQTLEPDFYVNLGDWPYADKAPAAVSAASFHEKHLSTRDRAEINRFLLACPVFATYDDHDITDNWNATTNPSLVETGITVWKRWFPLRTSTRYRSWRWGSLAEFFMLDTRRYRSANSDDDGPGKTMLGAAQKAWFKEALRSSTAPFKCVFTSVPLDFGNSSDDWTAFATERAELVAFIEDAAIVGVVFFAGDRHWFAAHHFPDGLREYQFGPLAAGLGTLPASFPPEVVAYERVKNFGFVRIERGFPPTMTIECRDTLGEVVFSEVLVATLAPTE